MNALAIEAEQLLLYKKDRRGFWGSRPVPTDSTSWDELLGDK